MEQIKRTLEEQRIETATKTLSQTFKAYGTGYKQKY